jgi:hypothetical protein
MTADPGGSSTVQAGPGLTSEARRAAPADRNTWRGPEWRVLGGTAADGKQVRDWITGAITRHGCPVDPGDAALVVSELFTNALVHGPAGGQVLAGYCLWPGGIRIVVCDGGGAGTPRLCEPGEFEMGGRGLHIVNAIAAAWASFRAGHAQAVWCDLGKPLEIPAAEAFAWLRAVLTVIDLTAPRAAAVRRSPIAENCGPVAPRRQVTGYLFAGLPALGRRLLSLPDSLRLSLPGLRVAPRHIAAR